MATGTRGFVAGFALATVLCGSALVFSAMRSYTPQPDGDWIRDTTQYPTSTDQINVLGDIAPGGGVVMQEIGVRLNALQAAGKKQNWGFATYESEEMEEAFDRLALTRPELASMIGTFITTKLDAVNARIAVHDKPGFLAAMTDMANGCTSCHQAWGNDFLVVKIGKSILPIQ